MLDVVSSLLKVSKLRLYSLFVKQNKTNKNQYKHQAIIKQADKIEYVLGIIATALEKLGSAEDLLGFHLKKKYTGAIRRCCFTIQEGSGKEHYPNKGEGRPFHTGEGYTLREQSQCAKLTQDSQKACILRPALQRIIERA